MYNIFLKYFVNFFSTVCFGGVLEKLKKTSKLKLLSVFRLFPYRYLTFLVIIWNILYFRNITMSHNHMFVCSTVKKKLGKTFLCFFLFEEGTNFLIECSVISRFLTYPHLLSVLFCPIRCSNKEWF